MSKLDSETPIKYTIHINPWPLKRPFFRPNMFNITEYLKEAREEIKKVVWPTREETLRSTLVVIAMSAAVAVFFWALDLLYNRALAFLIK